MSRSPVLTGRATTTAVNTGIEVPNRALLIDGLAGILGDSYVLEFKTRVAGWNVVGPLFLGLHDLMVRQGTDLYWAVDALARRMRSLGYPAPERLSALVERSELDAEAGVVHGSGKEMIEQLAEDHEAIARNIRTVARWASDMEDKVTADLLAERLRQHEEAVWQLKAMLA